MNRSSRPLSRIWLLIFSVGLLSVSCTEDTTVIITDPLEGESLYGIVRCSADIQGPADIEEVRFYYTAGATEHLIGTDTDPDATTWESAWYTPEASNGAGTVVAKAFDTDNATYTAVVSVTLYNPTRSDSIPDGAVKLTPQNDLNPPRFNPDIPELQDTWEDPVPLAGPVNTAGAEDSPFITPDGTTLYFWFNGDVAKSVIEQVDDPMTGIFLSRKTDGTWSEPERVYLNYYDEPSLDGAPTIHETTLWFASARAGNYKDLDMWTALFQNGRWGSWQNAGELFNQQYEIGELHVTPDGTAIYFDSSRNGGMGEKDIWVTRLQDGQWTEPENIAAVNTELNEGWPYVSEGETELWFTRGTPAPEIYRSRKEGGTWQEPERILTSFAGEPSLDREGNLYFAHHSWDETNNRTAEADIYVCYLKKE